MHGHQLKVEPCHHCQIDHCDEGEHKDGDTVQGEFHLQKARDQPVNLSPQNVGRLEREDEEEYGDPDEPKCLLVHPHLV